MTNVIGGLASMDRAPELFGNRSRTMVLVAVRLLGETFPSELALLLGLRLFSVQKILASLEREGVTVSRMFGRTRQVSLNPGYGARKELDALLLKMGREDVALQQQLAARRRRPRREGKGGLL
jgi:hypothetical protein